MVVKIIFNFLRMCEMMKKWFIKMMQVKNNYFLISDFHVILNVVCFLLGYSPAYGV
jgi:hypothetical protein